MISDEVRQVANAVLYEGYVLYPYRPSSLKNRQRWTFGGVFPKMFSAETGGDPWAMQAQCLVRGDARIEIAARFLHIVTREVGVLTEPAADLRGDREPPWRGVASLDVGDATVAPSEEAMEREIETPPLSLRDLTGGPARVAFAWPRSRRFEAIEGEGGAALGVHVRTALAVEGVVEIAATKLGDDLHRLTVRIENTTPLTGEEAGRRDLAQLHALASTHALLSVKGGAFLSLTDPPAEAADAALACRNEGCWPVLVGREGSADTLLASPIILYDYPQIAPESPGDLFDGLEIDEILVLRILAMTDAEKREAAGADPRVRALIERTENLTPAQMIRLHGALRTPRAFPKPTLATLRTGMNELCVGDRVRLTPKPGGDVMDIVLAGKIAVVEAIERDFEDRVHVAVTIEDDPGRDLGMGRFPGHRFFFSAEEMEPVGAEASP
ncbi:MAG: hypothetical protein ACR2F8_05915 [Caulobacteraceae bacterium]